MNVESQKTLRTFSLIGIWLFFTLFNFNSSAADDSEGPSPNDVRRGLQNRIEQQSEGRIKLASFAVGVNRGGTGIMEVNDEKIYPVGFNIGIEVAGPCKWYNRLDGRPLTFKTCKVDDTNAPAGENAIEVSELGEAFVLRGMALFTLADRGWKLVGFSGASQPKRPADEKSDQCFDQLRQLGLAFMVWAGDNNDRFPFNVSTNVGGTKEFCAPAGNGFDANAAMHFQVMSNELSTPKILVCPGDSSKAPAANFNVLEAENVSYLIHAGTEVDEAHPNAVLARCPVHGHTLYCDGHVERGSKK